MPATTLLHRRQPQRQRLCQPQLVGDLRQQHAARVRHQARSVRRDFYGYRASITHHPQGEPPVWWAYGAIHRDLSDEAYARALELLGKVDASDEARAAALMLRAEIEFTQAIQRDAEPDRHEQVELLTEAVALAPEWPLLRVRLARALHSLGQDEAARRHAEAAITLTGQAKPSDDPFDTAITGTGLRRGWAHDELAALQLLRD